LVVGLTYGLMTASLPNRSLPNTPGPAFFPWLIAVGLVFLSVVLLVQSLAGDRKEPIRRSANRISVRQLVMLGLFATFLLVLPLVGFLAAGMPFFAGLMWLYGERNRLALMLAAIVAPVTVFYIFRVGFNILLPTGFW
jgi:putative tricarboxylic transport membrane protein